MFHNSHEKAFMSAITNVILGKLELTGAGGTRERFVLQIILVTNQVVA